MKVLVRILILLAIIMTVIFYSDQTVQENDLLEAPGPKGQALPQENLTAPSGKDSIPRPEKGLSTLIGQHTEKMVNSFGEPDRIEPSAFGYEWWVYNKAFDSYLMVGVNGETINQVYIAGESLDASPYQVGQSIDDLYRFTIIESEITVQIDTNVYTFTINDQDMKNRLLVKFNGLFAQIYVDEEDREVEAIRFTDPKTLVLHQPYEMTYKGDYLASEVPSTTMQKSIDETNERQILDLTNVYRSRHSVRTVIEDVALGIVASKHSEDMALQNYFSHESPEYGDLEDRLAEEQIVYDSAAENLAANYYDSAEVVHGWLNSADHREVLLREDFTHLGVGTFGKYYTQNFVKRQRDRLEDQ
ncbi:CAP domain-containing protein [Paenisporosarcina quisquiliarum]|uniref:CAP domain-containing protein n=1 Tax=Paenisporosarcina quisquiliarum TaxID=365346 RepID=A0A9X3LHC9_9BACL|nr:CAP domain-containing protein [Paenisporosarcina quisquiliarum]MCZ8536424.1 CAP domain-containing protein [Paenisporosarcina quisquiliarum]